MTQQKSVALKYWFESSKQDWETAKGLLKLKRYHHALFFCHLSIEKIIKGKIVEKQDTSPLPIHDLVKLAKKAKFPITEKMTEQLEEITKFNLKARYDSYKLTFYKKATKEYTEKWFSICKKIYIWIQKQ